MVKNKKKDNTLLIALMLGIGVYMLTKKSGGSTTQIPPNYNQIPPAPPVQNSPAWQQWVAAIISVFGTAANLWAPGGPFYQQNISKNQAIEIANSQQYGDYV